MCTTSPPHCTVDIFAHACGTNHREIKLWQEPIPARQLTELRPKNLYLDKLENKHMNGELLNIKDDNLNKLKSVLPEVLSESQLDWEKLKAYFGDNIVIANERYHH